jgi:hypothetical protein
VRAVIGSTQGSVPLFFPIFVTCGRIVVVKQYLRGSNCAVGKSVSSYRQQLPTLIPLAGGYLTHAVLTARWDAGDQGNGLICVCSAYPPTINRRLDPCSCAVCLASGWRLDVGEYEPHGKRISPTSRRGWLPLFSFRLSGKARVNQM